MKPSITVYTKPNCPNCDAAKRTLDQKGLTYEARDTTEADTIGELVQRLPGVRQMPAIFINGQFVGGFAGLQAALTQLGL